MLGKPGGEKSDPDVLKELEEKIKNKTATKEEIVFANIDKTLNDEDYKELLAQGKELGLWAKDGEDKDAKYRANLPLVDEGRDAVNQAFVRGDFDKTTRDALLKDIDEKKKTQQLLGKQVETENVPQRSCGCGQGTGKCPVSGAGDGESRRFEELSR
ncbi:MAG: hypothetical protein V8R89_04570 [Alphaproteobacteria bacterium]